MLVLLNKGARARFRVSPLGQGRGVTLLLGLGGASLAWGQGAVSLPEVTVVSPRIANQTSAVAIAMPVSALRYEPRVDIQGRNLAEGQADITLRGGTFESTGLQLGAVSLGDPQTGHYLAEVPVAPNLLGAPKVVFGADLALSAANATAGALAYTWRPIGTAGAASISAGEYGLRRAELYQGVSHKKPGNGSRLGMDVALAHSKSDGAIAHGDHEFERANLRFQFLQDGAQTDVFAGYQGKRFGWPNLYTPFNSNESENLQTTLFLLNHRAEWGAGDSVEVGVFHRRNKDDYAFNRFAPVGNVHPFQHTTWLSGGAITARRHVGEILMEFRGDALADRLESTSLVFGRFRSRTTAKAALTATKEWNFASAVPISTRIGIVGDDTNRDASSVSPVVEIARNFKSGSWRRVHLSFSRASQVASYTALNSNAAAGLFRGNPSLGRSASQSFELGAEGSFMGWAAEAALFHRRDRALVDWTFRRGVTARTANPVDVDVSGLEAVLRRSWGACDVVLGYTALSKDADYRGARVDASFYALNYARHRLTAAFTVRLGQSVEVRVDNAARLQAANLLRVAGGDEALITSVGLLVRPPAWRRFEVSLRVDNAWNDTFQEVPAVPASPRQASLAAGLTW